MEDKEIISMLKERDESAIEELGRKYSPYLFSIAKNVLGNDADAEECVNEALYRAWRAVPPADPPSLSLFLAKIVREYAIDVYRSKSAQKRHGSEYAASLDELAEAVSPDDVENAVDSELLRDAIAHFLRGVPEDQRFIFVRRYFYFDPVKIIAKSRGVSSGAVKATLFRMRGKLKEFLEKEGFPV